MALPQSEIQRIHLSLRRVRFTQELALMKLPTDGAALIELARRERERSIEGRYNMAFIFYQLEKKGGDYWRRFDCRSVEELLTRFDLPIGVTLNKWLGVVQLFDKDTVLTLGEDSIFLMLRLVAKAQPEADARREDYEAIFAAYLKRHSYFDKTEFEKTVNWYVNTKYTKPAGLRVTDSTARPPRAAPAGTRFQLTAQPLETRHTSESSPAGAVAFRVDEVRPAAALWQEYAEACEQVIISDLGAERLPARPKGI